MTLHHSIRHCLLLVGLQHLDHGITHSLTNVHVRKRIAAVVGVGATWCVLERVRVHCGDVASKLGVLGGVGNSLHRIQDESAVACVSLHRLSERGRDKLGIGRAILDTKLLDELHKVGFVVCRETRIVRVTVSLPPEESGDFIALGARVKGRQVAKHIVRTLRITIVLQTSIPSTNGRRRGAGLPLLSTVVVAAVLPGLALGVGEVGAWCARRHEVPPKSPVSNARLEHHHWLGAAVVLKGAANAQLGANRVLGFGSHASRARRRISGRRHELIVEQRDGRIHTTAAHHKHVANILADRPVTGRLVPEVLVHRLVLHGVLERVTRARLLTFAKHVGLPHHDKDLDGGIARATRGRGDGGHHWKGSGRRGCWRLHGQGRRSVEGNHHQGESDR
eukprot:m.146067 g.146067  ORF g.146067 m.146067 type:complete len:392 (+) comp11640_c0_seq3:77-1252(+)